MPPSVRPRPLLVALAGLLALPAPASAGFLTVNNAGFENPGLLDNQVSVNVIPGWTPGPVSGPSVVGIYNPSGVHYPGGLAPEGRNVAASEGGRSFSQTLGDTLQTSTRYTLTVQVGYQLFASTPTGGYGVELLAGSTVIASDFNGLLVSRGAFTLVTVVYDSSATDPLAGQALTIRLRSTVTSTTNAQTNFDDVKLEATALGGPNPVPAPPGLVLLASGGVCVGLARTRRALGR
jgi:hypothetical protein